MWSRQEGRQEEIILKLLLRVLDYSSPQNTRPIWQCTAKGSTAGLSWALFWVTSGILGSVCADARTQHCAQLLVVLCALQSEESGLNQHSLKTKPPSPTKPFCQNIPVRTSVSSFLIALSDSFCFSQSCVKLTVSVITFHLLCILWM